MAKEYIEREAILRNLADDVPYKGSVKRVLMQAPVADVVEVVHGECHICGGKQVLRQDCDNGYYVEVDAEQQEMSVWLGDECLAVFSIDYCPNCGAKMDGGKE